MRLKLLVIISVVLTGILIAGCNTQQNVVSSPTNEENDQKETQEEEKIKVLDGMEETNETDDRVQ